MMITKVHTLFVSLLSILNFVFSYNRNLFKTKKNVVDSRIITDRRKLEYVIQEPTADPIELSFEYIGHCTNNFSSTVLGEGAFGKVYFGRDHDLGVPLAVKRVRYDVLDQDKMDQITISFKREISVGYFCWYFIGLQLFIFARRTILTQHFQCRSSKGSDTPT
jgi:hypothetical protein